MHSHKGTNKWKVSPSLTADEVLPFVLALDPCAFWLFANLKYLNFALKVGCNMGRTFMMHLEMRVIQLLLKRETPSVGNESGRAALQHETVQVLAVTHRCKP